MSAMRRRSKAVCNLSVSPGQGFEIEHHVCNEEAQQAKDAPTGPRHGLAVILKCRTEEVACKHQPTSHSVNDKVLEVQLVIVQDNATGPRHGFAMILKCRTEEVACKPSRTQ